MHCKVERIRLGLLLVPGALWGAGGRTLPAAAAATGALQTVRVALAAPHSLYHLPLVLADQLGYLRKAGLLLDWQVWPSGAQALSALQTGQADVLSGAFEHSLLSALQGTPVQAFFMFARTPQISLGISSRHHASHAHTVPHQATLRIGITAPDSATYWVARQWVDRQQLPYGQVRYVAVGAGVGAVEALRNGEVDLLCNPDPQMNGLEQRGELLLLAETRTLSGTRKLFGGLMPGPCLHSRLEVLMRQAPMVQALCNGLAQSLRWLQTAGPTDILRTVPSAGWMGDRAIYLGALERLRESFMTDGRIDEKAVDRAWVLLQRHRSDGRSAQPLRARPYTNEFATSARGRSSA